MLRLAAALAFASLGLAAPAQAQSSAVEQANRERFLALTQPLIDNIGTADTVILFYIGFDDDDPDHGFMLGVFYLAPGGKSVRVQGIKLGPVVPRLFQAAEEAAAADPEFRSASLVIDHGKPTLTVYRGDKYNAALSHGAQKDAERERVFPGLPLEPYRAPGS